MIDYIIRLFVLMESLKMKNDVIQIQIMNLSLVSNYITTNTKKALIHQDLFCVSSNFFDYRNQTDTKAK